MMFKSKLLKMNIVRSFLILFSVSPHGRCHRESPEMESVIRETWERVRERERKYSRRSYARE